MTREIALDTETTGFDPATGDRIVEIGAVEMVNRVRTGRHYHAYLNPERPMPEAAFKVHGLSDAFLRDKPKFAAVAEAFLEFIADAPLVIHNAAFDMKFLNAELHKIGKPTLPMSRAIDTVLIARQKFPGSPASLDALCKRFNIDLGKRTLHGALLDSELLAEVYLELLGGRQDALLLREEKPVTGTIAVAEQDYAQWLPERRTFPITEEEKAAHEAFLRKIKSPIWSDHA